MGIFWVCGSVIVVAQNTCPNADFSMGNFTNWTGFTGTFTNCCPSQGIVNGRHTIMTGGTDPKTNNILNVLPPGATRSARLGNSSVNYEAERLRYTLTVTPQNSLFIYKYAVVLEDPGHSSSDQPKFNIRVLNQSGNLIDPTCGFYSVVASGSIPGFQSAPGSVRWKNWTTIGLNLTPYMGQTITIEYTTFDCGQGAHYGYAYIACACEPMQINVNFCQGNSTVVLTAPPGFSYLWTPGNATTQSITLTNPTVGSTYNCTLTSANGCQVVLQAVLQPTIVTPSFTINSPLCSNTKNFQSTSTVNQGSIASYLWNFGNGATSTQQNPTYTYPNSGTYTVTLTVTSSMGGCTATTSQQVMVYPPPIANAGTDKQICQGQSTTLTASGGGTYQWSNGGNNTSITVSPTTNTTYTVTVTSSNGCTASDNAVVSIYAAPAASAGPNKSICRGSSTTLNGSGGTLYSWAPATGLSSTTVASPVASPTVTTTYSVTVTNAQGCTGTSSMVLTVNPLPNASAGPNNAICQGSSTTLTGSGGTTYAWAPAASLSNANIANPVATPTVSTTYSVTVANANGCSATSSKIVTVNPLPPANAGNDAAICLNSTATMNASGGTSYQWAPGAGLSNVNIANPIANPSTTTTYTVTVTNSHNCSATDNMVLSVNPLPIASAGPNRSICIGGNTTLQASGGTGYLWAPTTSLNNGSIASPVASPTVTTTYTVTVTNANGCTGTSSMVVTVNPLPVPQAGPPAAICAGLPTNLNVTGGVNYVWSPATGLSSTTISNPVATPTVSTTYQITVTDANGCTATTSKVVNVNNLPAANAGTDQIICLNQSVNLTAQGGSQYQWSNGQGTQSINVTPSATTTYTVTVSHSNGCSATDDVVVNVNSLPPADAGVNQAICTGNSTNLSATGGVSYVWSPSSSLNNAASATPIANPAITTTYTLTVTDINGCSATDAMVLTVHPLPPASAGTPVSVCNGHSTMLNGSGGVSYVWAPAGTLSSTVISNPTATPINSITYTVTVTDANTCSATASVVVSVNSNPPANAGPDASICLNSSTVLNASGGVSYSWSPATGLSSVSVPNPVASPGINTVYTVTVTDQSGCTATDAMTLTVLPLPPANAGPDQSVCFGTQAQLTATGGISYVWAPATTLSNINIAAPVATPQNNTSYTVTVTDGNGCSQTDAVAINLLSLPLANAGFDVAICPDDYATLLASGGISYVWSNGINAALNDVSPSTTTTYTVTVTDSQGCSQTDDVVVTVNSVPAANAGPDLAICSGIPGMLQASGGVEYNWSPSTGLSSTIISNPLCNPATPITYTVTVTDANGCTASDEVAVNIFPSPQILFNADIYEGCEPLLVHFTDSTGNIQNWQWQFGDTASGAMNVSPQQHPPHLFVHPGTYSITLNVVTTDGCQSTLTQNNMITVHPNPVADFTFAPPFGSIEFPFITFTDRSLNAFTWLWNFGDPASNNNISTIQNPIHKFSNEGNFLVTLEVKSPHGCVDSTSGLIRILPGFTIYIPNAFTPNGDGINDVFRAYGTNIDTYNMYIFDRWGEMLFETDNINIPWDGRSTKTGEPLMQDVYVYKIVAKDIFGEEHNYVGRVTLLLIR